MTDQYPYSLKIRNKTINFRKWKVKDKKNFIESIKNNNIDGINNIIYDCLEKPNMALSEEELKYVLLNIRSHSLGESLSFDFECQSCLETFSFDAKILEIMKPNNKKFGKLKANDVTIKIGEIPNKEYYDDALMQCNSEEERYLIDFVYHIKDFNGNDGFTFEEVFDYINNLDLDTGEQIFEQWDKMKFKLDNISTITCPHCKHEQLVEFDELYGFFPNNWFDS